MFVELMNQNKMYYQFHNIFLGDFPDGEESAVGKNLPANTGDTGLIPGPGRSHVPRSNPAHAPQLLKPVCLEPVLCNKRSQHNEEPVHCKEE